MKYVLSVCLLLLFSAPIAAQSSAEPQVTVTGHGEVQAAPDRADVQLVLEARDPDLAAARATVSKASDALLRVTDDLNIERKRIRNTSLNVRPEYRWNKQREQQELIGYVVSRQFTVDMRDLDKLGPLLERAVSAGVTRVSPPALGATREAEFRREALRRAGVDARQNAVAVAGSLDARVGAVRSIDAQQGYRPPPSPVPVRMRAMAVSDESAGDNYETGLLTFTADVTVRFDLQ